MTKWPPHYFVFAKLIHEGVFLLNQLPDLRGECHVGQIQAAVLVIVSIVGVRASESSKEYVWNYLSNSKWSMSLNIRFNSKQSPINPPTTARNASARK